MKGKNKDIIDNNHLDSVCEPVAGIAYMQSYERTLEYEQLEKKALKTLAGKAMIEFQEGKCVPADKAMQYFKRFVI